MWIHHNTKQSSMYYAAGGGGGKKRKREAPEGTKDKDRTNKGSSLAAGRGYTPQDADRSLENHDQTNISIT